MPATTKAATTPAAATGFTWGDVTALKAQREAEAIAQQQAFLAQHPDYAPCVIPGCTGTVGPQYVQTLNGVRTGFCPRTKAHAALKAEHDAAQSRRLG